MLVWQWSKMLKTLDEKKDVCDHENRCKVSLHNIVLEVKKDWKQFEDALKQAKVYKKISVQADWRRIIFWRDSDPI